MLILCREVDKYRGSAPIYYILKIKATARVLDALRLRRIFNPELSYYVTNLDAATNEAGERVCSDQCILTMFKKIFRTDKSQYEKYFIEL